MLYRCLHRAAIFMIDAMRFYWYDSNIFNQLEERYFINPIRDYIAFTQIKTENYPPSISFSLTYITFFICLFLRGAL